MTENFDEVPIKREPFRFDKSKSGLEREFYNKMVSLDKKRNVKFSPLGGNDLLRGTSTKFDLRP